MPRILLLLVLAACASAQQLLLLDAPPLGLAGAFNGVVSGLPPGELHKVFFFDGPALPGTPGWIGLWDKTHPNSPLYPLGDKSGYLIDSESGTFTIPASWVSRQRAHHI